MNNSSRLPWFIVCGLCAAFTAFWFGNVAAGDEYEADLDRVTRKAQAAAVKIYGAGGAGLEAYQSGFLVSPDGHIATAWSTVLDVEPKIVLDDGRRFDGTIVGFEPELDLAVIKIEATELPFLKLIDQMPEVATPVLAVSNLFGIAAGDEPASVMQGMIAAVTSLDARRGTFKTPYSGPVLILDLVANNPGAAGGVLVNSDGDAVGMLGKELRDATAGVWLNYALPAVTLRPAIAAIVSGEKVTLATKQTEPLPPGKAHSLATLGLIMVPEVLEKTPAFVDTTASPDSLAAKSDLRPDDLIIMVGSVRVDSQSSLRDALSRIDRRDPITFTVQRQSRIVTLRVEP